MAGDDVPFLLLPLVYLTIISREAYILFRSSRDCFLDSCSDGLHALGQELREDKRLLHCHGHRFHAAVEDGIKAISLSKPQTFPKFSQLPAEIRLQIWQEALPGPRAVMLRSPYTSKDRLRKTLRMSKKGERPLVWSSSTPIPALLHVSAEARAVALKRYKLGLAVGEVSPRIYIDLEADYVALSKAEIHPSCDDLWRETRDVDKIRHLAISYWGYDRFTRLPPLWNRFKSLQDIMMVRSVRWQYGSLPKRAILDFLSWAEGETKAEGITHWFTTWKDGQMTINDGKKTVDPQDLRYGV